MKTHPTTLLLLCAAAARGHDLYIMPSTFFPAKGSKITAGFHVGDSFPESEVGGRLDRLREPRLVWSGGMASFSRLRVEGKRDLGDVRSKGKGEMIAAVSTAPNLIELEPAKFTEYLTEEGLKDVIGWRAEHGESSKPGKERYSKFAKSILLSGKSNGYYGHAIRYTIEIIPEADPYALKAGDLLPIQVLFRGQPVIDALRQPNVPVHPKQPRLDRRRSGIVKKLRCFP